ncbi:MAG: phosphoribosyltransferase [Gemmatimonadales bacterium]
MTDTLDPDRFSDRPEAGRYLARLLEPFRSQGPAVLGMARGGVPVAAEVADALDAPLDVVVVRKIGAPGHPEFGIGAIASGIQRLDETTMRRLGIPRHAVQPIIDVEERELVRRELVYRHGRPAIDLTNRIAIVIDDGLATGLSARVAVEAVTARHPRDVVFAAPVCAPGGAERLGIGAFRVVCALTPPDFYAVGTYYEDFSPTEDAEVIALLDAAARRASAR